MKVSRSSNLLWQELKSKAQRAFREQLVTYENLLHTMKQLTAGKPTDFSLNFAPVLKIIPYLLRLVMNAKTEFIKALTHELV